MTALAVCVFAAALSAVLSVAEGVRLLLVYAGWITREDE